MDNHREQGIKKLRPTELESKIAEIIQATWENGGIGKDESAKRIITIIKLAGYRLPPAIPDNLREAVANIVSNTDYTLSRKTCLECADSILKLLESEMITNWEETIVKTTEENCHNTLEERLSEQARKSCMAGYKRGVADANKCAQMNGFDKKIGE